MIPKPDTTAEIQLDRQDEPREVRVLRVDVADETAMVEYPNTAPARGRLFGNIQEEVDWDDFVEVDGDE